MEFKQLLGRRRTIRYYLPHRPVERAKIQKMLEAARRASCVGNVNSPRAIVIWKEKASPALIKAITPPIGYQQMQTAPCFILWYHDTSAYEIDKWMQDMKNLAETRRLGVDVQEAYTEIERLRPAFSAIWKQQAIAPLAFMDVGLAVCQAMLTAYDEGLGVCMMSGPRIEQIATLLKLPESAVPVALMSVGYPAESWEAGGQTHKAPFGALFHEMEFGQSFEEDPAVTEELKAEGLIQAPAPLPWRDAELKYLDDALRLEHKMLTVPVPPAPAGDGSSTAAQ